ncbi:hypothetical protein B0T22DRAFT_148825 [Podospora appendiculata]|uniref:Uncharacterized protein n=1 Tax=Podospora appendiculata TaxID=314037 RepID=A0AAE0X946_9PEZI|nr:hypothetical protein B0T22DRAFT_148825 [Podospora appendiculata]
MLLSRPASLMSLQLKQCNGGPSTPPPGFTCPSGQSCIWLAGNTTLLCCPAGSNCSSIAPTSCNVSLFDAQTHPESLVKSTTLDATLPPCGADKCCPFGYSCGVGNRSMVCVMNQDQSVLPLDRFSSGLNRVQNLTALKDSYSSPTMFSSIPSSELPASLLITLDSSASETQFPTSSAAAPSTTSRLRLLAVPPPSSKNLPAAQSAASVSGDLPTFTESRISSARIKPTTIISSSLSPSTNTTSIPLLTNSPLSTPLSTKLPPSWSATPSAPSLFSLELSKPSPPSSTQPTDNSPNPLPSSSPTTTTTTTTTNDSQDASSFGSAMIEARVFVPIIVACVVWVALVSSLLIWCWRRNTRPVPFVICNTRAPSRYRRSVSATRWLEKAELEAVEKPTVSMGEKDDHDDARSAVSLAATDGEEAGPVELPAAPVLRSRVLC